MLFENTAGIAKACELVIMEELKLKEENNLFAKFPIGTTMQNSGKRKEAITGYNTLINKLHKKEKKKEKKTNLG